MQQYTTSIAHFSHESSNLQYQADSTMGKTATKNETSGRLSNHSFLKSSTRMIHPICFQKCISFFPKELVGMRYSVTKEKKNWNNRK